ncbi:hypothetical protein M951_chr162 (nucleomorph) [Lotharella oceanica]|uniref:Uncharacterized protein n=1 Tax=Lotharella oceanica TaxID=641309 RepID=A0A060DFB8_9EUKA|nr:hypothetical protein M951_chr162 [Lotharella oceanica]
MIYKAISYSVKKNYHHTNLNIICILLFKCFLIYNFLYTYYKKYLFTNSSIYILYNLFKTFKKNQNIIYISSSYKYNRKSNILIPIKPHATIHNKTLTLEITLLYKQISLNDQTIFRIMHVTRKLLLFHSDTLVSYNNKNLKIYSNINITYKGECFLFFLKHKFIINGVILNKFYSNNSPLNIYIQNNFFLNYTIFHVNYTKTKYYYNIFYLISFLKKNIHNLKINVNINSFLIQNISNHYTSYLKKYIYQLIKCFTLTRNLNQKNTHRKINNIQNFFLLKIYRNLNLLPKKKFPIKTKYFKKYKYIKLNSFNTSIIIENMFRNLIFYKNSLLHEKQKKNYIHQRFIMLNKISQLICINRNILFQYLNFNKKKILLISKLKNLLFNSIMIPLKRKILKNRFQKKKNKKKKIEISKKDLRNFLYHKNNKRWSNLILCFKYIIKTNIQVLIIYYRLIHTKT